VRGGDFYAVVLFPAFIAQYAIIFSMSINSNTILGQRVRPLFSFLAAFMLVISASPAHSEIVPCHRDSKVRELDDKIRQAEIYISGIANDIKRGRHYYNCKPFLLVFEDCDDRKISTEEEVRQEIRKMDDAYGNLVGLRTERDNLYSECHKTRHRLVSPPKTFGEHFESFFE